ncbi:hypothetical protein C8R45DRAFT_500333 [Mycena sanguinolenta]|nr:hypothetical protein C8R45DRAFT_500333 [Mycena sanguinolenta]
MDLQADSEPECIVVSTSDYTESTPCPGVVSLYDAGNVKSFVKSFNFLPSPRGRFQTSGTSGTHTRKYYSETKPGRRAAKHPVNNYNYYISGGFGGSGGEGGDQGGDGGAGHGPIVYLGQTQARKPSEFQTIRLGDINLIKEFKGVCFGVVGCQAAPGASVRRVYTAKLEGRESGHMTVAMYEGDGAEEAWNQHLEKYEAVRHPHIMQLYGLMSTEGLYAMVFHDELIPYAQFLCRFEHSPILSTYIIGYCTMEFKEATSYIYSVFRKSGIVMHSLDSCVFLG